jgi:hypothetical protein
MMIVMAVLACTRNMLLWHQCNIHWTVILIVRAACGIYRPAYTTAKNDIAKGGASST